MKISVLLKGLHDLSKKMELLFFSLLGGAVSHCYQVAVQSVV